MYPNTQESLLDSYIVERGKGGGSHMTLCFVPRSDDGNNSLRVCWGGGDATYSNHSLSWSSVKA